MQNYKGPDCTGELAAIDSRTLQMADGSPMTDYSLPVGTCYGWRTKNGTKWETEYYKDVYDPVTHTMKYTAHASPTCDDKPSYSDAAVCDKCVESCDGGWCNNYAGTIDGTATSSYMVSSCPASPPSPSPPPPAAKPPPAKNVDPTAAAENLAAAKAAAEEQTKLAAEKKKLAADKKAEADKKKADAEKSKTAATDARASIVAKIADPKVALEVGLYRVACS